MGQRGPIPLRSDEKGPRHQKGEDGLEITKGRARGTKVIPAPQSHWPPMVKAWYNSLKESGQSDFYEPSDWMHAQLIAESLAGWMTKMPKDRSAMMLDVAFKQMGALGTTEGERRRMRLELEVPEIPKESEGAAAQRMWKERLTGPATVTDIGGRVQAP